MKVYAVLVFMYCSERLEHVHRQLHKVNDMPTELKLTAHSSLMCAEAEPIDVAWLRRKILNLVLSLTGHMCSMSL